MCHLGTFRERRDEDLAGFSFRDAVRHSVRTCADDASQVASKSQMAELTLVAPAAQLDPDTLYSPEELAEPAAALVAKMSLEEEASLC